MSHRQAYRQFIEDMGDMMDEHRLPHMAGRVIGALLVCVPEHMAIDNLAESLEASKGAISMATQLLLRLGIIEKISLPGERRHFYRISSNLWEDLFLHGAEHVSGHLEVMERGLKLLEGERPEAKRRLLEMKAFMEFFDAEVHRIAGRWQKKSRELLGRRKAEPARGKGKDAR